MGAEAEESRAGRAGQEAEAGVPDWVVEGIHVRAEDPQRYANGIRDWARFGAASRYALWPDEVIARRPRPIEVSRAAAHFELAQHQWHVEGLSDRTLAHFRAAHELQPDNIAYKRQAYSAFSFERSNSEHGRFVQTPRDGRGVALRVGLRHRHGRPPSPASRANTRLASDLSRPGIERPWNVAGSDGLDLLGRPQMISVRGGERVLLRLHRSQRYGLVFDSGHLTHRAPVAQLAASAVSRFWGVSWGVTLYQASCTRPSSSMRNADRWTPVNSMPFGSVTLPQTS